MYPKSVPTRSTGHKSLRRKKSTNNSKKRAVEEYAKSSLFHGVSIFFENDSFCVKLIWAFIFVAALALGGYQVWETVERFVDEPTATNIAEGALSIFPPICICPKMWLDLPRLHQQRTDINILQYALGVYQIYQTISRFHQEPTATNIKEKSLLDFPAVSVCPVVWLDILKLYEEKTDINIIRHALGLMKVEEPDILTFVSLFDPHTIGHSVDEQILNTMATSFSQFKGNQSLSTVLQQFAMPSNIVSAKCKGCKNATSVEAILEVRDKGICYALHPGALQQSTASDPQLSIEYTLSADTIHAYSALYWLVRKTAGLEYEETEGEQPVEADDPDFIANFTLLMKDDFWAWMDKFNEWMEEKKAEDDEWMNEVYYELIEEILEHHFAIHLHTGDDAMTKYVRHSVTLQGGRDYSIFLRVVKKESLVNPKKCKTQMTEQDLRDCYQVCVNEKMLDCYQKNGFVGQSDACIWFTGESQDLNNGSYCSVSKMVWANNTGVKDLPFITCAHEGDNCTHPNIPCLPPCSTTYAEPSILPSKPKNIAKIMITITPMHPYSILILEEVWMYTWDDFYSNIGGLMGLSIGASMLSFAHMFYHFCLHPCQVWHHERKINQ